MYTYKERIKSCSGCDSSINVDEHELYHLTGLAEGIIKELGLKSVEDVEDAFRNSQQLTKCYINLNGRKTKIREENRFILPRDIVELIPDLRY